jgi:cell division septum initiation protein DivIVA
MENDVQHLIDLLYDMIDNAKGVPLGNEKCVIERDRALDYLDEIRAQLPAELEESRKLIAARNDYIAAAKKEVENMKARAENSAKQIVSESETLAAARAQGRGIVDRAEQRANELCRVSNEYTDDTLRRAEEALQTALDELKQSHANFAAASREKMQDCKRTLDDSEKAADKN